MVWQVAALLAAAPMAVGAQQPRTSTGEAWQIVPQPQSSLVLARDGTLVGEIGREWRTSVPLRSLPRYVPQAFVAVEDHRFYQHDGVDLVGVAGALKDAMLGDPRGASTITQQLVGNMHPDIIDRRDRSPARKLREQAAAREMERHYDKEQILEAYLNLISFGHGWYGIDAASRHYFGKPAAQLTLVEAATLAAMPKGPAIYDPIRNPDRARARRNLVLDLMRQHGYITVAQADAAKSEPVRVAPDAGMSVRAPYFVDAVRANLERLGVPIADGGLRIHTTLDPGMQIAAIAALAEGTAEVEARPGYRHRTFARRVQGRSDYLQGMAITLDPRSGEIRALVGGRDYAASSFNRATAALRQPGSAFKPFVYATAIADSILPNAWVADTAIAITLDNGTVYKPDNADVTFLGELSLRDALAESRNTVAVQLGQELGIDRIAALARASGITTPIAPYLSSAIGASAVRPIELVTAYAPFANGGFAVEPRFVTRIQEIRNGRVVWTAPAPRLQPVLDPRVAFIVRDMLRDAVERGTAASVRRHLPPRIPAAGKTGTTNDNTDVWFVGMTPDLLGGVWLGFDRPVTITPGAAGGSLAAPIWGRMMARWYAGREPGTWTTPEGVVALELDRQTGFAADSLTPPERRYTEYFLEGTEPGAFKAEPWRVWKWGPIGGE